MPLFHCETCHHEWEAASIGRSRDFTCDWCGGAGFIIEEQTPLEKMLDKIMGDPNIVNKKKKYRK